MAKERPTPPVRRAPRPTPPAVPAVPADGWMTPAQFFRRWGIYRDSLSTLWTRQVLEHKFRWYGQRTPRRVSMYRIAQIATFEAYLRGLRQLRNVRGDET
jgi:hypothetical protein